MSNESAQVEWPRMALLREALAITSKDRHTAYGQPEDNFQNIADNWNVYLRQRFGGSAPSLNSMDVAYLMILMKMARLATNQTHRDSLVDVAGYAACGADCQEKAGRQAAVGQESRLTPGSWVTVSAGSELGQALGTLR